jgi:ribosome-interacting GTPase 1
MYKGAKIQVIDLPGIIEGAKDGKGRGKQVIAAAKTCSVIMIVLDAMKPLTDKKKIERELEGFGIRLNKQPPNIIFKKKDRGGISISMAPGIKLKGLDQETITSICKEYRISSAAITFRCNATADELIDVIEGGRKYMPCIYVLNKVDQLTIEELDIISKNPHYVPISGHHGWNIDGLVEKMWEYLNLIRVYTKPKGQVPDYQAPVVLPQVHRKVSDFCRRIHKSLLSDFKTCLVWGKSVKHNPQRVGLEHELMDEDVVQIIKK